MAIRVSSLFNGTLPKEFTTTVNRAYRWKGGTIVLVLELASWPRIHLGGSEKHLGTLLPLRYLRAWMTFLRGNVIAKVRGDFIDIAEISCMYTYLCRSRRRGAEKVREEVGQRQSPLPLKHGAGRTRGVLSPAICRMSKDQSSLHLNTSRWNTKGTNPVFL